MEELAILVLAASSLVLLTLLLLGRRRTKKLEGLAGEDFLTAVGNQRGLWDVLGANVALARRSKVPLSVIIMDLDRFKEVNDSYGHGFGDQVLKQVAKVVNASCRGSDQVFRYGGDEFVVLCPHTDLQGTLELAGRLDKSISALFSGHFDLSACFGVAELGSTDSGSDLIDKADIALFTAKRGKRKIVPAYFIG